MWIYWPLCVCMFRQHDGQDEKYTNTLKYLNWGFTGMFTVECILKILAFGVRVRTTVQAEFLFPFFFLIFQSGCWLLDKTLIFSLISVLSKAVCVPTYHVFQERDYYYYRGEVFLHFIKAVFFLNKATIFVNPTIPIHPIPGLSYYFSLSLGLFVWLPWCMVVVAKWHESITRFTLKYIILTSKHHGEGLKIQKDGTADF